jgi:hypothetical protein
MTASETSSLRRWADAQPRRRVMMLLLRWNDE